MKKRGVGVLCVLLVCAFFVTCLPISVHAETESSSYPIEAVLRGSGEYEVRYEAQKLSDTVFLVENEYDETSSTDIWNSSSFLRDPSLRIIVNLPDDTTVSELYNGKGDPFDLSKDGAVVYENGQAIICIENAYDSLNFGYHSRSGCYYVKLSNGVVYILVCDSQGVVSNRHNIDGVERYFVEAPQSIQLYNVDTDYFYEEYAVTDLQVFERDHGTIVSIDMKSETPIRLRAQATYEGYGVELFNKTSSNASYYMQESCYGWALINGERTEVFSLESTGMSTTFTLKPGLNVVEVYGDTGGFSTVMRENAEWYQPYKGTKSTHNTHSVVYLIEYTGESASLSDSIGTQAELDLNALKVFSFMLNKGPLTEKQTIIDGDTTVSFSLPVTSAEAPPRPSAYYERGVLLYMPPMDSGTQVEIIDETEDGSFVSGKALGYLYAINPSKLGEDGNFQVKVTSEDGKNSKFYTFHVTFAASDTTLTIVSIEGGELDEEFRNDQNTYLLTYAGDTAIITFSAPEGAALSLDKGENTTDALILSNSSDYHTVTVTAADGLTKAVYYFISQYADGTIPYFSLSDGTEEQVNKLLAGYRDWVSQKGTINGAWGVFMAKAAADDLIEWDGKYIEDLENNIANRQATDPARNLLEAVLLGENPYHFDPNGDGEFRNFVDELLMWCDGGAWANNIWYDWAARAAGLPTLFDTSLKANAISASYDLDMRAWTVAALLSLDGVSQKNMVPYVESLKNVQIREDNPISDLKYTGLWRMVAHYSSYDTNAYTIGTVLSAFGAAGVDPDRAFAVTASDGTVYEPLDQIEKWLWDEETGTFCGEAEKGVRAYVKDIIIGLGDILQGSNVWNRCALTEDKFNDLVAKAGDEAKAAALTGAELEAAPAYGEADYGKYYYFLYEAVADELEASGDTSMRPKVIWDTPVGQFQKDVAALPEAEDEGFLDAVAEVIALYEKLYGADGTAFTDAVRNSDPEGTDTLADYQAAVAAALKQQDDTGDTADFYTRVMALPDALIITEDSRDEVDALRDLYDHMSDEQQALVDWAGKSVLLKLMAAEAVLGTPEDQEPETMTIYFTLLGAPNDGEDGEVNTLMDENLELWYETEQTFNAESLTAEQVFRVIMGEAGIAWRGNSQNQYGSLYVSGIQSPLTGEWMEEFTTTNNSGWMYTVNGTHPSVGLSNWTLYDGDEFVMHFTDDYTKEEDAAQYADQESGSGSGGSKEPEEISDTIVLEAEETEDGAAAALDGETAENWLAGTEDDSELTLRVDGEEDKTTLTLEAEAVAALAEADTEVRVELGDTALLLDAETMDELAKTGEDVAITVETGEDGETKLSLTAGGKTLDAALAVELPSAENAQVLAILRKGGQQEIVRKSVVSGDKVYAEIPAGVTVKAVENKKTFEDVKDGDWYADAVAFATSHELFRGVGDGLFAPKSQMTRAMLVTVLYRLSDEPAAAGGTSFDDVVPGSWYADAVAWASAEGIVLGNGEGFAPNDNITREQIATILYRYMKYLGEDVSAKGDVSSFSDGGEVSAWAKDAMAWAVKVGLFQGNADGTLNPGGEATRAEVATLMERLVKLLVLK